MKKTPVIVAVSLAFAVAACGDAPPAEAPAATASPAVEAPVASAAPAAPSAVAAAPAEKPKEAPPALNKPKSKYQVGDKSLSDIDGVALTAAFQKVKVVQPNTSAGGMTMGQYETINFNLDDGKKLKGKIYVVRPTAAPTAGSSSATPPAEMITRVDKATTAFIHDPDGDVFISLELTEGGKPADAQRILGSVVKKGK